MTLAVMALYADGTTRLTGIASWRVKETDRIAAMAAELRKVGAGVVEGDDFIEVTPPRIGMPRRSTPTTTTAWRCACRWRPSTAGGRVPARCASSTRSASARPSPTTSRPCSPWHGRHRPKSR
jgi:hypothetical protein